MCRQADQRPRTVLQKVPLLVTAETMQTTHGPMHELRAEADWLEAEGKALAVSVFGMQPWLDLPNAGCSVLVVGTEIHESISHARRLAHQFWQRRADFEVQLHSSDSGVSQALTTESGPNLLVDSADSTSSGSPGDSTAVLKSLLSADMMTILLLFAAWSTNSTSYIVSRNNLALINHMP